MKTKNKLLIKDNKHAGFPDFKTKIIFNILGFSQEEGDGPFFTKSFLRFYYIVETNIQLGGKQPRIALSCFDKREDWPKFSILFTDISEFSIFAKTLLPWCQGKVIAACEKTFLRRLLVQQNQETKTKKEK
jgi:hypothetical protein